MSGSAVKSRRRPAALLMNLLALLALGVLVYIGFNTDFGLIWSHVRKIPTPLFVLLLILQVATQLALNYQWFRLCKALGLRASFMRLLAVNAYGVVVDAANPGEKVGGELARVLQLNNMMGFSTRQSTSLVTIQKSLSLSALLMLNIVAVIAFSGKIPFLGRLSVRILVIALLLALGVLIIYALFFTEHLNARIKKIRSTGRAARWIKDWMAGFVRDTKTIGQKPGEWFFQFGLSFMIWAMFPIKLYIIVSGYADISLFMVVAITFIAYFAAMIPLLPGGLGTFEATMSGLLVACGLPAAAAMAVSLVFRFITFWFVVMLSAVVIVLWKASEITRKIADEKC
jgi:uncharacterized protein (TIRG00374 family)